MLESLETLNYRLARDYGYFDNGLKPLWRIIYSHDEFEKRWVTHDEHGNEYEFPKVEERPKYRQWADHRYILERCLIVPPFVETDLVEKYSYEPVWVFQDNKGNPLPPRWDAIQLIIQTIYQNASRKVGKKYKDPNGETVEEQREIKEARINKLQEELFGNETETGDALAHKEAIVVPGTETVQ